MKRLIAAIAICVLSLSFANALLGAPIFAPGDPILGGQREFDEFIVGTDGTVGGLNNWPGAEGPEHNIDGVGQKYLNFGKEHTGFLVQPSAGPSIADSIQFWAANDAVPRDPTGYELWGTNEPVDIAGAGPGSRYSLQQFTAISTGPISLPDSRNAGGNAALEETNSVTATFADNTETFSAYLVIFPDVKDNAAANSMQIAEVQVYGQIIPEPTSALLLGLGITGLGLVCRRRRPTDQQTV